MPITYEEHDSETSKCDCDKCRSCDCDKCTRHHEPPKCECDKCVKRDNCRKCKKDRCCSKCEYSRRCKYKKERTCNKCEECKKEKSCENPNNDNINVGQNIVITINKCN